MPERTYKVHAPALSLSEATRLPAMERDSMPRNLILPDRRTYYPMPVLQRGHSVDNCLTGSIAGKTILRMVGFPKEKGRA